MEEPQLIYDWSGQRPRRGELFFWLVVAIVLLAAFFLVIRVQNVVQAKRAAPNHRVVLLVPGADGGAIALEHAADQSLLALGSGMRDRLEPSGAFPTLRPSFAQRRLSLRGGAEQQRSSQGTTFPQIVSTLNTLPPVQPVSATQANAAPASTSSSTAVAPALVWQAGGALAQRAIVRQPELPAMTEGSVAELQFHSCVSSKGLVLLALPIQNSPQLSSGQLALLRKSLEDLRFQATSAVEGEPVWGTLTLAPRQTATPAP
jgi:hypothetical protein